MNVTLGFYDRLAFVSYSLIALSYTMRDIKWLRILTIVSCLVDLFVYYYIRVGQPMWVQLAMNVLFITINSYQLYVLWRDQAQHAFDGEQGWLYKHVFSLLTPGEFKRLHTLGSWQTLVPAQQLLHKGTAVNEVSFVVSGQLNALWDNNVLNTVDPGGLVGEMSYLTGRTSSSDVVARGVSTVHAWARCIARPQAQIPRVVHQAELHLGSRLGQQAGRCQSAGGQRGGLKAYGWPKCHMINDCW